MKEKTIKEVSGLWRRDKKQYVKASTYAAYILILENHILPAFGDRTTISESEVQEFVITSLNNGLAQKTVRDMLIVLKMIIRFGAKLGCDWKTDWDIKFPTVQQKQELEVLSIENHRKVMRYIREISRSGILVSTSAFPEASVSVRSVRLPGLTLTLTKV